MRKHLLALGPFVFLRVFLIKFFRVCRWFAPSEYSSTSAVCLRNKRQRRKNMHKRPCHGAETGLSAATTASVYVFLALELSLTNLPGSNVYRPPLDLCFAKSNHDVNILYYSHIFSKYFQFFSCLSVIRKNIFFNILY